MQRPIVVRLVLDCGLHGPYLVAGWRSTLMPEHIQLFAEVRGKLFSYVGCVRVL